MTRIATFLSRSRSTATAIAAATGAWLAWTPLAGAEHPGRATIADLVERTSPAVVTVLATQEDAAEMTEAGHAEGSPFGPGSPFEEFFRRFGMPEGMPMPQPSSSPQGHASGVALGSGFVIDDDGYIVTNNHVVDDAESGEGPPLRRPRVRRRGHRHRPADRPRAASRSTPTTCRELALGDSDAVRVGEDVIAVGNPFGLGGTVTRGIVSAMARDINAGPYVDFIQTDAAINRGNSGGPLLNLEGEVIGVNSAIYSPNGGSVGVGFAIPSNTVKTVVAQLQRRRLGRARLARRARSRA